MQPRREKGGIDPVKVAWRRRRVRWVVGLVILTSLLAVGYSSFEATRPKIRSVTRPTTHAATQPRPPILGHADAGGDVRASSETARSCDELRVLVDRSHALPPDYAPDDLVSLRDHGVVTLGGDVLRLRRDAAEHLASLVEAAAAAGEELVVASAYRSYEEQQVSYERLASVYGADANGMSATPGHSQHQLGTAVDFTNAAASYQVWLPFGRTSAYWWLEQHAGEYGFVLAYPSGEERETGYQWEPWHYRYVGVENADRIAESGLGLQEFLEREGVVPRC